MLPQPDPHVLVSNPQFALLYKDLESAKLERNGRSRVGDGKDGGKDGKDGKDGKVLKERREFGEALHNARVEEAKREVLKQTLAVIGYRGEGLPDELQQVVQIVSAQLQGKINDADREIVEGEVDYFLEQIAHVEPAISAHIQQNTALLSKLVEPSSPSTDLTASLISLKESIASTRHQLSSSRTTLATATAVLLDLYTHALKTCIRLLEQTIHGSVARHTRARATYLSLVAEGIEKKYSLLKAQTTNQVYDKETRAVLADRMEEVEGEIRMVVGVLRRRETWLEELERQGRGLEKVAEEVQKVREEIGKVRSEVERLEMEM